MIYDFDKNSLLFYEIYEPDESGKVKLKDFWQWNHIPNPALWSVTEKPGTYLIPSGKVCYNLNYAVNTLTQRAMGPVELSKFKYNVLTGDKEK
jgi:hypothetical protein